MKLQKLILLHPIFMEGNYISEFGAEEYDLFADDHYISIHSIATDDTFIVAYEKMDYGIKWRDQRPTKSGNSKQKAKQSNLQEE